MNLSQNAHILLVEDNPADVRLAQEAVKSFKIANELSVVMDGESALRFLNREGEYKDATRPDLILLDLNLPGISGQDVLSQIRGDGDLKSIPVVVLTSSEAEQDILMSYQLACNCYITKPLELDQFVKVVQAVEDFWFSIVKLPPREGS